MCSYVTLWWWTSLEIAGVASGWVSNHLPMSTAARVLRQPCSIQMSEGGWVLPVHRAFQGQHLSTGLVLSCVCRSLWISSHEKVQTASILHSQTESHWGISFSAEKCFPLSSIKAPAGGSINLTPFRKLLDTSGISSKEWELDGITKNYMPMPMEKPFW